MSRQIAWSSLTKSQFPLPELSQKLEAISNELEDGCGMVCLRGISPERYTADELRTLWYGLCLHLGIPVYQNSQGQLLREICNEGEGVGKRYGQMTSGDGVFLSSRARTASTAELRFHTDRADIVGLLCVGRAKSGGETRIASSVTVHNEMIRRRPALATLLYAPIFRSRLGEEQGGGQMFYPLPVFGCREGKFTSHYSRTYVEADQLVPEVPTMMDEQWVALDLLEELEDEKFNILRAITLEYSLNGADLEQKKEYRKCPSTHLRTTITAKGVYICPYWRGKEHMRIGDLNEVKFSDMWNGSLRKGVMDRLDISVDCASIHCLRHDTNLTAIDIKNQMEDNAIISSIYEFDRFI